MEYTIVYKTYENDLEWLKYSLLSIDKFVSGMKEVIIYYHDKCFDKLIYILNDLNIKFDYRLIAVEYDINGYLKQMVIKCDCYKDVTTDYILIMDCDVIIKDFFKIESFLNKDGKINWFYLNKNEYNCNDSQWSVWEKSIMNMVNENMDRFYMYNSFPFLFKKETLKNADDKFSSMHNITYNEFCKKKLNELGVSIDDPITGTNGQFVKMASIFEEFEYLGWYSYNHTNDYNFIEGPSKLDIRCQFWSHGGLTDEIREKIEEILK